MTPYFPSSFQNVGCGNLKIRGIEARRHDTPSLFSRCQNGILELMAEGNTINEVKALVPKVNDIFQKYAVALREQRLPIEELVFTERLSKNSNEYQNRNTVENDHYVCWKMKASI